MKVRKALARGVVLLGVKVTGIKLTGVMYGTSRYMQNRYFTRRVMYGCPARIAQKHNQIDSTAVNSFPTLLCLSIELASLTRCSGHGADRCERATTAPFFYNRGLLNVAEALHTRVKSKSAKAGKSLFFCTISAQSQTKRS